MNTAQTFDPYAERETRRVELINESAEKERALRQRISDSKDRVLELRADADKLARGFQQKRADALRAEAATLEDIARTLTNVDLPKLRVEAENIRMGRHAELSRLAFVAEGRIRSNQEDQKRAVQNALVQARADFESHIAKLATKRTLELARALADAATAAGGDCGSLVTALLATERAA
jgi:ABC-type branched-subunit amino acid transport system ATPase component